MMNELLVEKLNNLKLLATNNYPLCNLLDNCNGDEDNITGDEITENIKTVVLPATYEIIAQNILSFPYIVDTSNDDYYVTKYLLPDDKVITKITDMRNENLIIFTLSGDVPNGVSLIKKIYIENNKIRTEYS